MTTKKPVSPSTNGGLGGTAEQYSEQRGDETRDLRGLTGDNYEQPNSNVTSFMSEEDDAKDSEQVSDGLGSDRELERE